MTIHYGFCGKCVAKMGINTTSGIQLKCPDCDGVFATKISQGLHIRHVHLLLADIRKLEAVQIAIIKKREICKLQKENKLNGTSDTQSTKSVDGKGIKRKWTEEDDIILRQFNVRYFRRKKN